MVDIFEICRILFGRFTWGEAGTPFPGGPLKTASPDGLKWHETVIFCDFKPAQLYQYALLLYLTIQNNIQDHVANRYIYLLKGMG
jgi:hypothetical protein